MGGPPQIAQSSVCWWQLLLAKSISASSSARSAALVTGFMVPLPQMTSLSWQSFNGFLAVGVGLRAWVVLCVVAEIVPLGIGERLDAVLEIAASRTVARAPTGKVLLIRHMRKFVVGRSHEPDQDIRIDGWRQSKSSPARNIESDCASTSIAGKVRIEVVVAGCELGPIERQRAGPSDGCAPRATCNVRGTHSGVLAGTADGIHCRMSVGRRDRHLARERPPVEALGHHRAGSDQDHDRGHQRIDHDAHRGAIVLRTASTSMLRD